MRLVNLLFVSVLLVGLLLLVPKQLPQVVGDTGCTMTTLNIGQGDAILFRTSDHHTILFDGGPGNSILDALGRQLPPGTRTIDLVVNTHPDADHLAGLVPVLEHYEVKSILTTGVSVTTKLFQQWQKVVATEGATMLHAQAGQVFTVGDNFRFEDLWPREDFRNTLWTQPGKNGVGGTNDTSVVGRVLCSGSSVMMTADASHDVEEQLAETPNAIRSTALKIGHHGSRYSTALVFLQAVQPKVAVISVGAKNRYGHPHPTVLDRLQRLNIPWLRTDEAGDVVLVSAGDGTWTRK